MAALDDRSLAYSRRQYVSMLPQVTALSAFPLLFLHDERYLALVLLTQVCVVLVHVKCARTKGRIMAGVFLLAANLCLSLGVLLKCQLHSYIIASVVLFAVVKVALICRTLDLEVWPTFIVLVVPQVVALHFIGS